MRRGEPGKPTALPASPVRWYLEHAHNWPTNRLQGGKGGEGWGEALRPRAALGHKIDTMNSISISLAHKALHTPLAA